MNKEKQTSGQAAPDPTGGCGSGAAPCSAFCGASDDDITDTPLCFVVCAAIRHTSGLIICGPRHYDPIMRTCILARSKTQEVARAHGWYSCEQGFVDNKGQWLTREAAWKVADRAGQIRYPNVGTPGTLYSENLY